MHADSLASYTLNFQCQAAISGFLAKSFRSLGLMNISSRYLDRAKKANDMIKDSDLKQFILVDLLHEQAYHSLELKEYLKAGALASSAAKRSEEHTSELQSRENLVCRLLLEKKHLLDAPNQR